MRHRLLFLFTSALVITGFVTASCSGDPELASQSSNEKPAAPANPGGNGNGSGSGSGNGSSGNGSEANPDVTLPTDLPGDLGQITNGLGKFGDCIEIAAKYGSLYFEALAGPDGARKAKDKAEELKKVLPTELAGDIDVVADAIGKVATDGISSSALSSPEYEAADKAITDYLKQACEGSFSGDPQGGGA